MGSRAKDKGLAWVGLTLVVGGIAALSACSSDDGATTSSTSASSGQGGGGASGGAGGAGGAGGGDGGMGGEGGMSCADQDNAAAAVEAEYVAGDMPAPTGGPIGPGTYHLMEQRRYTGPGGMEGPAGAMWQETAIWSATEVRSVVDAFDGEGERRLGLAYDLGAGSGELLISVVCPEPLSVPWDGYTVNGAELVLHASSTGPFGTTFHYERQTEPPDP
ncbi:MAG: hypothetical protein RIF41_40815 [Polyangiaceae bacterium]